MDEEEYNRICKNIQQENKYIIKEGLLYTVYYYIRERVKGI